MTATAAAPSSKLMVSMNPFLLARCSVTDLAFDHRGERYVTYGRCVARYTLALQ
ncbi:hypothetical protein Oter_1846 [Opitutus terrae PB90-1]|uniref:Uncharacterized protein n=1 Tax=Opitutus terrae (strain DSM 11246 / JCM 15787 / PB90-1) TaxID=452637 RepID=B1ZX18_OPITP|nr:hypothetical protein Oter_1846 [Opitutus terrae PB90-1]